MDTVTSENVVLSQDEPILPERPIENQPKNNFLVILLSVLLTLSALIAGFFASQTQKLVKEITLLKVSPTPITTVEPNVEPIAPESRSTGDISVQIPGWKYFVNDEFSFQYPGDWDNGGQGDSAITASDLGITISIPSKSVPMNNECMKLDKKETLNSKIVKYYSYSLDNDKCSNNENVGNKEAWVTKTDSNSFQAGIIYRYNTNLYPKSLNAFQQIISTFKFTN